MRRLIIALAALILCLGAAETRAAEAVVTDVRVGIQGKMTRLVFDLTDKVAFKVFTLAKPYRVVIDLPEVGWRLPPRPLPSNTGLLNQFRYGLFKAGTSRIVLDVKGTAAVEKTFLLCSRRNRN